MKKVTDQVSLSEFYECHQSESFHRDTSASKLGLQVTETDAKSGDSAIRAARTRAEHSLVIVTKDTFSSMAAGV